MTPSNVLRKLFIDSKSLGRWCLLGCALVGAQVSAQGTNSAGWSYYPMPDGRTVVYSSGAPVGSIPAVSSAPSGALVVSGGKAITTDGTAAIKVAGKVPMTITKGAPIVLDVAAKVSASRGAALLVKGLKILPVLSTGFALYDLAKELGYDVTKTSAGDLSVGKFDTSVCTTAPCYQYRYGNTSNAWGSTPTAAAGSMISAQFPTTTYLCYSGGPSQTLSYSIGNIDATTKYLTVLRTATGGNGACSYMPGSTSNVGPYPPSTQSVAPSPSVLVPSTPEALQTSIETNTAWPTSSVVSTALRDASNLTGEPVPIDGPTTVTGPATSAGPTSTVQNSDGTKSVTSTTNNHTYQGDTINTTTVTTTNNYNSSNQITSSTTVTAAPAPEKASDCDKNPDSNACRKDEFDVPTDQVPKTTKTITWAAENLGFGSGQCIPSVTLTNRLGTQTISFQPYCDAITTWVKPLVLAFSLLAAFFIVAPIKQEGI